MKSAWIWIGLFLVLAAPILIYGGSSGHSRLPEDEQVVWSNPAITGPGASLALEGRFFDPRVDGFRPVIRPLPALILRQELAQFYQQRAGFQWVQLVFLGLIGALFGALLLRLTGSVSAAVVGGLALVAHPVGAHSVLTLSGMSDLTALGFLLASMLMADVYFRPGSGRGGALARTLSWVLLLLALWSKETAFAAVPILLISAWASWSQRQDPDAEARPRASRRAGMVFAAGVVVIALLVLVQRVILLSALPEHFQLGRAVDVDSGLGWGRRLFLGLAALPTCLRLYFLPTSLGYVNDYVQNGGLLVVRAVVGGAILAWLIWLTARGAKARASYLPWAGLTLFSILGAVGVAGPVGDFAPQRILFQALPGAIGLILCGCLGAQSLLASKKWERVVLAGALALVVLLGLRSFLRCRDYQDWETLVHAQTEAYPTSAQGWFDSGNIYLTRGEWSAAISDYVDALKYRPDSWMAWVNLGTAYYGQAEAGSAVRSFQKALDGVKGNRALAAVEARALYNLALIQMQQNRNAEAAAALERVLKVFPDHVAAHANLGMIYSNSAKYDAQSLSHLRLARGMETDTERRNALDDMILRIQQRRASLNRKSGIVPESAPGTVGQAPE